MWSAILYSWTSPGSSCNLAGNFDNNITSLRIISQGLFYTNFISDFIEVFPIFDLSSISILSRLTLSLNHEDCIETISNRKCRFVFLCSRKSAPGAFCIIKSQHPELLISWQHLFGCWLSSFEKLKSFKYRKITLTSQWQLSCLK